MSKTLYPFSQMLELVEEYGGEYRGGNSWDSIWFHHENNVESSQIVFDKCKELGLDVYGLVQINNENGNFSYFNHK
jgi:hypothetical protein